MKDLELNEIVYLVPPSYLPISSLNPFMEDGDEYTVVSKTMGGIGVIMNECEHSYTTISGLELNHLTSIPCPWTEKDDQLMMAVKLKFDAEERVREAEMEYNQAKETHQVAYLLVASFLNNE